MGGLLVTVQQAQHRSFDALICAGHGGTGLPEVLTEDELAVVGPDLRSIEPRIRALAQIRFDPNSSVPRKQPAHGTFFADDVPAAVRDSFADQSVPLLPTCGLTSMIPDSARAERASIDVPTFLAFGDNDLITEYCSLPGAVPLDHRCRAVRPRRQRALSQSSERTASSLEPTARLARLHLFDLRVDERRPHRGCSETSHWTPRSLSS